MGDASAWMDKKAAKLNGETDATTADSATPPGAMNPNFTASQRAASLAGGQLKAAFKSAKRLASAARNGGGKIEPSGDSKPKRDGMAEERK